jgi:hypothetical protein
MGHLISDKYQEWWNKKSNVDTVKQYIDDKFRADILSEQSLHDDVAAATDRLVEDLSASRNRLYVELRLPLAKIKSPILADDVAVTKFNTQVQPEISAMTPSLGRDSVAVGVAGFLAGNFLAQPIATDLTDALIAQIVARLGTSIAADAALEGVAIGGDTVGCAGLGAGLGSVEPGAGTVIGFGVGLATGAAIDWWMSDKFEAKVTAQCNGFLDDVQSKLISGDKNSPGLEGSMQTAVQRASDAQRKTIVDAIPEAQR